MVPDLCGLGRATTKWHTELSTDSVEEIAGSGRFGGYATAVGMSSPISGLESGHIENISIKTISCLIFVGFRPVRSATKSLFFVGCTKPGGGCGDAGFGAPRRSLIHTRLRDFAGIGCIGCVNCRSVRSGIPSGAGFSRIAGATPKARVALPIALPQAHLIFLRTA